MSLIEHERAFAQSSNDKRMIVEIGQTTIRKAIAVHGIEKLSWLDEVQWESVTAETSVAEVSRIAKCSVGTADRIKAVVWPRQGRRTDWSSVDWSKPVHDLALETGYAVQTLLMYRPIALAYKRWLQREGVVWP